MHHRVSALFLCVLLWLAAPLTVVVGAEEKKPEAWTPEKATLKYNDGLVSSSTIKGEEPMEKIAAWVKKLESGPVSEHAKAGKCKADGTLELYKKAGDEKPARSIQLFSGCKHMEEREMSAEQYAALKKIFDDVAKGIGNE